MSDTVRVCVIAGCGKPLVRKPGEKADRWLARRWCPGVCADEHRRLKLVAERPQCGRPGCGERTKKPERKYCSQVCTGLMRRTASGDAKRAGREREQARREGRPAPTPQPVAAEPDTQPSATPVELKPARAVWRPAGFSKIPNAMAGHRPPEPDPEEEAS